MDFRTGERLRLISSAGWRLLFAACIGAAMVAAAMTQHYWVALVAFVALALALLDAVLLLHRRPLAGAERRDADLERRLEGALALLDTVTVALFVLDAGDRVRFANRAGRLLAGFDIGRLRDIPALGEDGAAGILALPAGGRQLVGLANGRSMLVWIGSLSTPGDGAQRLVSMQAVAGELDAVQVAAWHMMTRVLAHEMMNSLTPIVSLADSLALLLATSEPRLRDAVETIARRSRHLMHFVERYRAVVDLPQPQLVEVGIAALFTDIERLASTSLQPLGIAFSAAREASNTSIRADPALLEQAVLNLVKNAVEAVADRPAPRIELACVRARDLVTISVIDNGIGIDDGAFETIFVPFYTTKADGAGIGLTFARQVALAHGGRLSGRALAGGGTAFDLVLPAL